VRVRHAARAWNRQALHLWSESPSSIEKLKDSLGGKFASRFNGAPKTFYSRLKIPGCD
jgi:hypothetical protein